jgi:molecular chaperone DnaK
VHVLQGEREMARYNRTLGKFHLDGIPPAPRGRPQVEVAFDIDANGIVHVSAKDLGTGKEQKIIITSSSGLNDAEIERMVKEAESHSDEDKERRRQVETRNQLDALVYNTEKTYNEHKEKLGPDEKGQLEQALAEAKQALESEDTEKMQQATSRLEQASHKLAEKLYQSSDQSHGAAAGAGPGGGDGGASGTGGGSAGGGAGRPRSPGEGGASDEVIDAEYVDVDEKR